MANEMTAVADSLCALLGSAGLRACCGSWPTSPDLNYDEDDPRERSAYST